MDTKSLRIGIVSSIIASVLTAIFISPILSFVWKLVVGIAGTVHQGYVDDIYSSAAMDPSGGRTGSLTFAVFLLIVLCASVVFLYLTFAGDAPRQRGRVYAYSSGTALGLIVGLFVPLTIIHGIFVIDSSFNQRLTVLAPAISDAEYKTLKARWVTMHGKADYDALVEMMDKRATELGVTLPPVRRP
jgi:hypothetical protein